MLLLKVGHHFSHAHAIPAVRVQQGRGGSDGHMAHRFHLQDATIQAVHTQALGHTIAVTVGQHELQAEPALRHAFVVVIASRLIAESVAPSNVFKAVVLRGLRCPQIVSRHILEAHHLQIGQRDRHHAADIGAILQQR